MPPRPATAHASPRQASAFLFAFLLAALLAACPSASVAPEPDPIVPLAPPDPALGFQLTFEAVAPPGEEIWLCSVYPVPIESMAAVNWVEYQQTPGSHHTTISTMGAGNHDLPLGMEDCPTLLDGRMDDLTMIFGGQGDAEGEMHLPEGVAASLPPTLDIVHEMHFVNTTTEPVALYSRINAYTIPESVVEEGIWGGSVRDENINIAADSTHSEWSRCVMNRDVEVIFLAGHTHGRGDQFTVRPFDGTNVGDELYRNDDLHSPGITQYDPPLVVPAGTGFEWTCTWDNRDQDAVNYGVNASDEMCNLTLVHTPFDPTARCEVVETSDGVLWAP